MTWTRAVAINLADKLLPFGIDFKDKINSLYVGVREESRITKGFGLWDWKGRVAIFEMGKAVGGEAFGEEWVISVHFFIRAPGFEMDQDRF